VAGIWNVNNIYNSNMKKLSSKLTFQLGEIFSGRLVSLDGDIGEGILKLLDGWQFPVKVEKNFDLLPGELLKFQVVGFEDGKLKIKLVPAGDNKEDREDKSIDSILAENNIDSEEYGILEKMIRHNMPLTRENISKIKNYNDLMKKIDDGGEGEEEFIKKYLDSKNIDINTIRGKEISEVLKGFFKELKNIDLNDLLILIENNVEVNAENIESFNKIFKGSAEIYKVLIDIGEGLIGMEDGISVEMGKNTSLDYIDNIEEPIEENLYNRLEKLKGFSDETILNTMKLIINSKIDSNDIMKYEGEIVKNQIPSKEEVKELIETLLGESLELNDSDYEVLASTIKKVMSKDNGSNPILDNKDILFSKDSSDIIKEQIRVKTDEMKNIIKDILVKGNEVKSEAYSKIIDLVKTNINDFKVFNTMSNGYYYMDLPIGFKDNEYPCKLIIKDERNKGKKIDSKNVKLVVSIKTINMGTIDSYIKVKNFNVSIEICSEEKWIKALELAKEKLLKNLEGNAYSFNLNIAMKEKEANLTNCREFFEDVELSNIDIKV
jgi:hypothetical protein